MTLFLRRACPGVQAGDTSREAEGGEAWKPIETVPLYTAVLLAWRADGRLHSENKYGLGSYSEAPDGDGRVAWDHGGWDWTMKPTHWMHIPALPQAQSQIEERQRRDEVDNPMTKNLTPSHLRCGDGACPSLHQLEDGRLVIVGENISDWEALKHGVQVDPKGNETAIIISPDLLSDYVAEQVTAERERCARIAESLKTLKAWLPTNDDGTGEDEHSTVHGEMIAAAIRQSPSETGGDNG